jgi:hypothetical protein
MNVLGQTRFVERLQFFNGQRLFATDLQGLEAFNRELRWLHNRSLHQPGIGSGFGVSGAKGAREVKIGAGYAIDALGREIILTEDEHVEPIPPVAADEEGRPVVYYLTVSYPSDDTLEHAETRSGVCVPAGAVRLRERPVICWIRLEFDTQVNRYVVPPPYAQEILEGWRLVLGQATVENCQLSEAFCVTQRRSARPSKLPRFRCGETCYTGEKLQALFRNAAQSDDLAASATLSVRDECDTICSSPCYVVRVELPEALSSFWTTIGSVTPKPDGFDAELVLGPILATTKFTLKVFDAVDAQHPLCLHWLAIET